MTNEIDLGADDGGADDEEYETLGDYGFPRYPPTYCRNCWQLVHHDECIIVQAPNGKHYGACPECHEYDPTTQTALEDAGPNDIIDYPGS